MSHKIYSIAKIYITMILLLFMGFIIGSSSVSNNQNKLKDKQNEIDSLKQVIWVDELQIMRYSNILDNIEELPYVDCKSAIDSIINNTE